MKHSRNAHVNNPCMSITTTRRVITQKSAVLIYVSYDQDVQRSREANSGFVGRREMTRAASGCFTSHCDLILTHCIKDEY